MMRTVLILLAAVLVAVAAAVVGLTLWLDASVQDWRDVVIIIYGVLGILFFLAGIVAALGIYFAIRYLVQVVADTVEDPIKPALEDAIGAARTVRGGVEFVTDSAVQPVIRVVAVMRGVRRGVDAVAGFARRGR